MGDTWQRIWDAVRADFSDLPDAGRAAQLTVRLLLAAILGGVLGYEREVAGKSAGMRTHMLVALGAALFVLVPQQAGVSPDDLTRVLQGLITGIGFIGAGSILKSADAGQVHGLTTAAGIWLTAAIGVAAGLGREATAVLSTVLALIILAALPHVGGWFNGRGRDAPPHP
jgi:putative Mg2+ transporter-C (MgtC) family protein